MLLDRALVNVYFLGIRDIRVTPLYVCSRFS